MKILFFRGIDGIHKDPQITSNSDESTLEFDPGDVINVDSDEFGTVTIYTSFGSWYITLTKEELDKINHPNNG